MTMHAAVTADRMRQLDKAATDRHGIPGLILMENAGRSVAEEILKRIALVKRKSKACKIALLCGKGNNGGDGMVCARYLSYAGQRPDLYIMGDRSSLRGDPQQQLAILQGMGISISQIRKHSDLRYIRYKLRGALIVDAIFGISFSGEAQGVYGGVIDAINKSNGYVLSVDVPSGLDATTGIAARKCVEADRTITMGALKTGLLEGDGPRYAGSIKVVDIGLPCRILKEGSLCRR